jgi:hypothetical protein
MQVRNDLSAFRDKFSILLLNDWDGRNWAMVPQSSIGTGCTTDWISGNEFFIRNKRQPNLYWWVYNDHIHTSDTRRTKFRITKTTAGFKDPVIMIRDDDVTVEVVAETVSGAGSRFTQYVSIEGAGVGGHLQLSGDKMKWKFGALLRGEVGERWDVIKDVDNGLLVHMIEGGGDEWELV